MLVIIALLIYLCVLTAILVVLALPASSFPFTCVSMTYYSLPSAHATSLDATCSQAMVHQYFVYIALGHVNGDATSGSMKGWKCLSFQKRPCIINICKSRYSWVEMEDRWIRVRFPAGARYFSVLHNLRPALESSQPPTPNDCLLNCRWPSPAQWPLIPSPTDHVTIFYCLVVLGAFQTGPSLTQCVPGYILPGVKRPGREVASIYCWGQNYVELHLNCLIHL